MDQEWMIKFNAKFLHHISQQNLQELGLGLAIVQRIMTEHHGSIHVNSQPGHGTRFEVRLPA